MLHQDAAVRMRQVELAHEAEIMRLQFERKAQVRVFFLSSSDSELREDEFQQEDEARNADHSAARQHELALAREKTEALRLEVELAKLKQTTTA